jgi:hypothetical protein
LKFLEFFLKFRPGGPAFVVLLWLIDCSCHGSISGRELSLVSDVAHACAVGYHTARFVAGIRADALRKTRPAGSIPWFAFGRQRSAMELGDFFVFV